jgi:predicted DNA-binding transcriptional regulator AlpA
MHPSARTAAGTDTVPAIRAGSGAGRKEPGVAGQPDELLTINEVITELRVPRSTFYRWRQAGTGPPAVKLPSGAVRIRRTALAEWLRGLEDNPREHAA